MGCVMCPMSPQRERVRGSKRYDFMLKKWMDVCNSIYDYNGFDNADDMMAWWLSGLSIERYRENKKQLSLFKWVWWQKNKYYHLTTGDNQGKQQGKHQSAASGCWCFERLYLNRSDKCLHQQSTVE